MTVPPPTVRLLVCGSADRGDDGAALAAVARVLPALDEHVRQRLEIRRCEQLDVTDLVDIPRGTACLILDTVVGVEPGEVVTLSLPELAAHSRGVSPRSSHALPIDQVLGIAEALRGALPDGRFIGLGGHWFGFGSVRSRAVRLAMPAYQCAVREGIVALAAVPVG
ncbi:MAG TPA: hypothetical protein VKR30_06245 [Candidatus Limnocylindrales bacterium]|nr:hypothetical protein [Candidatus Limnocylindrales bacterium]